LDTSAAPVATHAAWVRAVHWCMALSTLVLIASGWTIYNASPLFAFEFPAWMLLGSELKEALLWHLAFMWLLLLSLAAHLVLRVALRRGAPRLLPLSAADAGRELFSAMRLRLAHEPGRYNAIQRLMYVGVSLTLAVLLISGAVLWKPVQLSALADWMGGFQQVRLIHFIAMVVVCAFVAIHILMVLLVPRTMVAMLAGQRPMTLEITPTGDAHER
jgi:thiosulfate reductase cytochrome b subunit